MRGPRTGREAAGPSATALLLTILVDGRRGLRAFRSRLLAWRVVARWYAIAVLAAPVLGTAVALTLSLFSPEFRPGISVAGDKTALLLLGHRGQLSRRALRRVA